MAKVLSKTEKRLIKTAVSDHIRLCRAEICENLRNHALELFNDDQTSVSNEINAVNFYVRGVYSIKSIQIIVSCNFRYKKKFFYTEKAFFVSTHDLSMPYYAAMKKGHVPQDIAHYNWDKEKLQNELFAQIEIDFVKAIREIKNQLTNPNIKHLQPLLEGEIWPYQKAISAASFVEYYNTNCSEQLRRKIVLAIHKAGKPQSKTGYYIALNEVVFEKKTNDTVILQCGYSIKNEYLPSKMGDCTLTIKLKLTDDMDTLVNLVEETVEKKLQSLVERIWKGNFPEKYDFETCRACHNDSDIHAFVDDLIFDTMKPYSRGFETNYVSCFIDRTNHSMNIEKKGRTYYLRFPIGEDIPLKPANRKLLEQHMPPDYYNVMASSKKQPIPSNTIQWYLFCEYLAQVYEKVLAANKSLNAFSKISIDVRERYVTVSVSSYQINILPNGVSTRGNFPMLTCRQPQNAYDLADAIIRQAIDVAEKIQTTISNRRFHPIELEILNFLKKNPGSSETYIKTNLQSTTVPAKNYDHYMQRLFRSPVIYIGEARGVYCRYETHYVARDYINVDFSQYVKPYTISDIQYLNTETQITIIKNEFAKKQLKSEYVLHIFEQMVKLPKKVLEELCQDESIVKHLNKLPLQDIDFIKASLAQIAGNSKIISRLFTEQDYQQLEKLAANVTQDRTEAIADIIMTADSRTINEFFKSVLGKQFLTGCNQQQLEVIADALFCVTGCRALYKKISNMLS